MCHRQNVTLPTTTARLFAFVTRKGRNNSSPRGGDRNRAFRRWRSAGRAPNGTVEQRRRGDAVATQGVSSSGTGWFGLRTRRPRPNWQRQCGRTSFALFCGGPPAAPDPSQRVAISVNSPACTPRADTRGSASLLAGASSARPTPRIALLMLAYAAMPVDKRGDDSRLRRSHLGEQMR